MDPITHAVIGASISKFTGNTVSISDAASVGVIIGSMFPDIDILFQKWGDYVYLKNHRGISHSILGICASSALIALGLIGFYPESNFISMFLWSLLGCFSHTFFDLFNSYGAKLLWPFVNKKYSFSLLVIFDPVFFGLLVFYILSKGPIEGYISAAFVFYLLLRVLMRLYIRLELKKKFRDVYEKINILPSMTGLLRWHFILETENCNIVGETNILKRSVKVIQEFYKLQDDTMEKVLYSPVGTFFSEFTPLFHIACEKVEGVTRYVFTDMRYYIRNNFLHHAVLEMDENDSIVRSSFNPYSMKRSVEM